MFKIQKRPMVGHIHSKFKRIPESVKPHWPNGMRRPFSFGFGRAPQSTAALFLRIKLLGENIFLSAIWDRKVPVKGNMSSSSLPKSTPDPVCVGLCEKWDEDETIREKLRGGEPLVPEGTGTDGIRAAVSIKSTLMPLLARMAEAENKLPEVEALREEIQKLYVKNKQCRPASDVEADSWTLRKLCTFVKKKCRRVEVSLESWLVMTTNYCSIHGIPPKIITCRDLKGL